MSNNQLHKIGLDPGFGGFKAAEITGETLKVRHLPSVVGTGNMEMGLLGTGFSVRKTDKPLSITFGNASYLVGNNVHLYARPVERLDFQRLADGPELRALLYASLGQLLGAGEHRVALMLGLPVEVVQDKAAAQETLRRLRSWLVGEHRFVLDGEVVLLTITQVKGIAQPVGAYFAWGANVNGHWTQRQESLEKPVAICDIGFNTLDLFAVEQGQVVSRFTGGDNLGMHRVADAIIRYARQSHKVVLSLYQADALMRTHLAGQKAVLYHPGGEVELGTVIETAMDESFAAISQFIRQQWERGTQFRYFLLTGGGAEAMRSRLLRHYPQAVVLPDAVTANAVGLAKFACRRGVLADE